MLCLHEYHYSNKFISFPSSSNSQWSQTMSHPTLGNAVSVTDTAYPRANITPHPAPCAENCRDSSKQNQSPIFSAKPSFSAISLRATQRALLD